MYPKTTKVENGLIIAVDTSKMSVNTNVVVDFEKCVGCGDCVRDDFCPAKVFAMGKIQEKKVSIPVRAQHCVLCTFCRIYCPANAIDIKDVYGEIEKAKGSYEAPLDESFKRWLAIKYER